MYAWTAVMPTSRPCAAGAARASSPRRAARSSLTSGVAEELMQNAVLPLAGDLQVARREADADEPVAFEDALGRLVVDEGVGLYPVQAELGEGDPDDIAHRCGRYAPARGGLPQPVAEAGGLGRAADDVVEIDPSYDGSVAVDDDPRQAAAALMLGERGADGHALTGLGEVFVAPERLPWREELPVRPDQLGQGRRIVRRDQPARRCQLGHLVIVPYDDRRCRPALVGAASARCGD